MSDSTHATTVATGHSKTSPEEIFAVVRTRESALSRLLMAYISSVTAHSYDQRGYLAEGEWEVRPQQVASDGRS